MKYVGKDVDIDPYDRHYWAQRFFQHLKKQNLLTNNKELSVKILTRELIKFTTAVNINRDHMMHFMLNERYVIPTAEATYEISWDKVR